VRGEGKVIEYHNEDGSLHSTYVKVVKIVECPKCKDTNIKDKGSFSKCMKCGERIIDTVCVEEGEEDEPLPTSH